MRAARIPGWRVDQLVRDTQARWADLAGTMNEQQGRFDQTNEQARSRSDQLAALLETHAASVQAQSGRLNDVSNQVKRLGPLLEKSARDAETRWADLAGALNEQSAKLEERSERTRSRIDRLAELLDEQAARTAFGSQEAEARSCGLAARVQAQEGRVDLVSREVERIGQRFAQWPYMAEDVFASTGDLDRPMGYAVDAAALEDLPALPMRFDDLFRGSKAFIADRQRAYLPFLTGRASVVDLGCGRGEFLRLLADAGSSALGVEQNPELVRACRADGLNVIEGDAIEYLRKQPEGSIDVIFSAQFIEHVDSGQLPELLRLAKGRLTRGGLFIAETVNPESFEALKAFHVDLTHQRPIYPQVLLFKCHEAGFPSARIFYPLGGGFTQRHYETAGEYAIIAVA